ncbi:MAG: hypothetical protein BJ554DRAFT_4534, partial [Olpidium bornovanus]
ALYNLLTEPGCRRKYAYNPHNIDVVRRVGKEVDFSVVCHAKTKPSVRALTVASGPVDSQLKNYITDTLVDQMPNLEGLQRALEELVLMPPPPHSAGCSIQQAWCAGSSRAHMPLPRLEGDRGEPDAYGVRSRPPGQDASGPEVKRRARTGFAFASFCGRPGLSARFFPPSWASAALSKCVFPPHSLFFSAFRPEFLRAHQRLPPPAHTARLKSRRVPFLDISRARRAAPSPAWRRPTTSTSSRRCSATRAAGSAATWRRNAVLGARPNGPSPSPPPLRDVKKKALAGKRVRAAFTDGILRVFPSPHPFPPLRPASLPKQNREPE